MIHMQLVSVHVCTRPDAVEITDQDFMTILHDTNIVEKFLLAQPLPYYNLLFLNMCHPHRYQVGKYL